MGQVWGGIKSLRQNSAHSVPLSSWTGLHSQG